MQNFTDEVWSEMENEMDRRGYGGARNDMDRDDYEALLLIAARHAQQQVGEPVAWRSLMQRMRDDFNKLQRAVHFAGGFDPCYVSEARELIAEADELLESAPQPQPDWVPCSERLPDSDDFDERNEVWFARWLADIEVYEIGLYSDDELDRLLNGHPVVVPKRGNCFWKPTGLTRPQPPEGE